MPTGVRKSVTSHPIRVDRSKLKNKKKQVSVLICVCLCVSNFDVDCTVISCRPASILLKTKQELE